MPKPFVLSVKAVIRDQQGQYLVIRRSARSKNNAACWDFPGGKVAQGRRDVTNVPAQALALLNDPFVLQQAELWGQHLAAGGDSSIASRIDAMFQTSLGRLPSDGERQRFEQAVQQLAELHRTPAAEVLNSQAVWKDVAHAMFNLAEFIYIP